MPLRLGATAPDFTAETTEGRINFHEWIGNKWAMLFLTSQGLHACLHDRARLCSEAQTGVRQTEREGHRFECGFGRGP